MQGTQQAPRTKAQLEAMYAMRGEMEEQLQSLTERRGQLVQQRLNAQAAGSPGVAAEYETRIKELGERTTRIEREKLRIDDLITEAVGKGVGRETEAAEAAQAAEAAPAIAAGPPEPPFPQTFVEVRDSTGDFIRDYAVPLMLGEALVFVLLGVVLWQRTMKRMMKGPASGAGMGQLGAAVDAIALEVERISENQRYVTKLLNEKLLEPGSEPAHPIKAKERVGRSD